MGTQCPNSSCKVRVVEDSWVKCTIHLSLVDPSWFIPVQKHSNIPLTEPECQWLYVKHNKLSLSNEICESGFSPMNFTSDKVG